MLEVGGQGRLLDLAQPRRVEQLRQVALTSAGQLRFILDVGVELAGRSARTN